jgi:hypothetical protein
MEKKEKKEFIGGFICCLVMMALVYFVICIFG